MAEEPPQMRIFLPCSVSGRGVAGMVGRCIFRVESAKRADGGVWVMKFAAWAKSVVPICMIWVLKMGYLQLCGIRVLAYLDDLELVDDSETLESAIHGFLVDDDFCYAGYAVTYGYFTNACT